MNGTAKVWEAVEAFRRQYFAPTGGMLPVDVFSLVELAGIMPNWLQSEDLRTKFAEQVAPRIGVHAQSILTRLDREGLWPAP